MLDVSELEFLRSFIRMGKRTPLYAILITHPPTSNVHSFMYERSPPPKKVPKTAAESLREGSLDGLMKPPERKLCVRGHGPMAAIQNLVFDHFSQDPASRQTWLEEARLHALLGGLKNSLSSFRSGLRCYLAFTSRSCSCTCAASCSYTCAMCLLDACFPGTKQLFPPKLAVLLAWSTLFRCSGTWGNYLSYVKTGCLVVNAPVEVHMLPNVLLVVNFGLCYFLIVGL